MGGLIEGFFIAWPLPVGRTLLESILELHLKRKYGPIPWDGLRQKRVTNCIMNAFCHLVHSSAP